MRYRLRAYTRLHRFSRDWLFYEKSHRRLKTLRTCWQIRTRSGRRPSERVRPRIWVTMSEGTASSTTEHATYLRATLFRPRYYHPVEYSPPHLVAYFHSNWHGRIVRGRSHKISISRPRRRRGVHGENLPSLIASPKKSRYEYHNNRISLLHV